jgi:hypothetical protein
MACDKVQGGGRNRADLRRTQPARFRNGPNENQAAEKLPKP